MNREESNTVNFHFSGSMMNGKGWQIEDTWIQSSKAILTTDSHCSSPDHRHNHAFSSSTDEGMAASAIFTAWLGKK